MAVPQDGSASTLSIPPRSSSLAGAGDATRLEQHSRSEQFFDSAYITWPAPRSRYLPPRRSSHDDVEPFPDFQDPSTSLIIARTLLLDHLYSFQRRAVPGTPFQSLHSRIVPSSGHIKEGEDLTRCRASVEKVLGAGQALRARRMQGSYGKPARLRGTDPNMCFGKKEAEPKQLMKMKLKTKVKNGIAEALRIERAFSRRAINGEGQDHGAGEERGRSAHRKHRRARAATPAAHTPKTVMKTLMMLRETYPLYYKSQALPVAASLDSKDQPARKSAEDEQQPTGLGVTLVPSLGHADSQPVLGSGREHLPALPCRSHKPLRTAASMTSLKSAKQTTKALLRRAAAKVGVCRSSASRWEEGTASWDMKSEEDKTVDLGRGKHTVHVSERVVGIDTFPVAVRIGEPTAETPSETRRPSTGPGPNEGRLGSKRHGRYFVIERGAVHLDEDEASGEQVYVSVPSLSQPSTAPPATAMTETERDHSGGESAAPVPTPSPSLSPSPSSLPGADPHRSHDDTTLRRSSSSEAMDELACAEMVRFSKPSSPPRLLYIRPRRPRLPPPLRLQAEASSPGFNPKADEATATKTAAAAAAAAIDEDWFVISPAPDASAAIEDQDQDQDQDQARHHRHVFRGYVTRPTGRPQSMTALSQSQFRLGLSQTTSVNHGVVKASHARDDLLQAGDVAVGLSPSASLFSSMLQKLDREVLGRHGL